MTGKLSDLSLTLDGKQRLTVETSTDCRELFNLLQGVTVDIDIKKHRERRSLSANAYCWVLVDKIAAALGVKKVDVYRRAIRDIGGVSFTVAVRNDALEALKRAWEGKGIGWQVETRQHTVRGYSNAVLYFGSSEYDTAQMSALINSLIDDAKELGIETKPQDEIDALLASWEDYEKTHQSANDTP